MGYIVLGVYECNWVDWVTGLLCCVAFLFPVKFGIGWAMVLTVIYWTIVVIGMITLENKIYG